MRIGNVERTGDLVDKALVKDRQVYVRWLIRRVGIKDRAEDLLQEFYLRAKKNAPNLRAETKITPWLYRVLHSTLIDTLRAEEARKARESEFAWIQEIHAGSGNGAFQGQSVGDVCRCLRQTVAKLKHGYRELVGRIDLSGHDLRAPLTEEECMIPDIRGFVAASIARHVD